MEQSQSDSRNSPTSMRGNVVWLTGASSGLGEAFARRVARTGCVLAITARRADVLKRIADDCNRKGGTVHVYPGNVTDRQQVKSIAVQIERDLGPIEKIVASAGTHLPTEVTRFDPREYESIMQLNYSGVLYCIEAVLPLMIERRRGHIVGVASVAGYRALPRAAAYGASKAAINHFLDSIRFDLAPFNIDVTVVNPGFVRTPLTDKNDFEMPHLMEADDAAEVMLRGIEARKMEVHFPWKFTYFLKILGLLPFFLYYRLVEKYVVR